MGTATPAWSCSPALSQQNSPANTVLLLEIQNQTHGDARVPGADVTNPLEVDSGVATGSNAGFGGTSTMTNYSDATYATGYIGGYSLNTVHGSANGIHSDGANYLACDGHVKWLRPVAISGGLTAASATAAEIHDTGMNNGKAAGTGSMTQAAGNTVALTFSPV